MNTFIGLFGFVVFLVIVGAIVAGALGILQTSGYGYAPAAYGQYGHCYFIRDRQEAIILQQEGLCKPWWTPYPMPASWHATYELFYDSPSYYGRFPSKLQTRVSRYDTTWARNSTNRKLIAQDSTRGTWKNTSTGQTASGRTVRTSVQSGKISFTGRSTGFSNTGTTRTGNSPSITIRTGTSNTSVRSISVSGGEE